MQWYNEPWQWNADGSTLTVKTKAKTDFWRKTHYGFIRDGGHFYYQPVSGNFLAQVKVTGQYRDLYDQAGLMVRRDELHWLKCGIELVDGIQQASAVVTRDFSDWSVVSLPHNPPSVWFRLRREGTTLEVFYSLDGAQYTMLRLAYLPLEETADVGLMCASPQGEGCSILFENFQIE